jgi:hypothetical protein
MMLRATVRDCLYLNWALPAAVLPEPPAPLRYQLHPWQGEDYTFVSALLFYQEGLHVPSVPLLWLTYPQCNVRFYVLDGNGIPSVLFRTMMMPAWVASGIRLVMREPAASARLDFPRPSRKLGEGRWHWRVERAASRARSCPESSLEVTAWQGSPQVGYGPRVGSWEQTVEYFQERPRGYLPDGGELRKIDAIHPPAAAWPLQAEVGEADLLSALLPLGDGARWPALHSVFLCPEIPFAFELGTVARPQVVPGVPQAAASRSAARRRLPHYRAPIGEPIGAPMLRDGAESARFEERLREAAAARERRGAVEVEDDAAAVEIAVGA